MASSVRIPNPLYDVVFRYLMDDERVARLLLSAIIGETVETLDFQSTEQSLKLGEAQITVTRMDFRARIRQADGTAKMVLIELQKAKLYQQIGRFRRYLGQQYQRNLQSEETETASPLPIYPIYILGKPYSDNGVPVVRVRREAYDAANGQVLNEAASLHRGPHTRRHRHPDRLPQRQAPHRTRAAAEHLRPVGDCRYQGACAHPERGGGPRRLSASGAPPAAGHG
ncbi:MAG: hypothetical protein OHK0039_46840 [Bacteroidia bacterium]